MGLIPKTGEQHLIENNNINQVRTTNNKKKKQNNISNTIDYTKNHNNKPKQKTISLL